MRALSASDLLRVWERGFGDGPIGRALELLRAACPETGFDALAGLTIGQRDALLLRLRQHTFGAEFTGAAECERCGEQVELVLRAADLVAGEPLAETTASWDGYELRLRPPDSRDLTAASHPDLARARVQLLERCLIEARYRGEAAAAAELPDEVVEEAERRLAEADPVSDIRIVAVCPACGARQPMTFDIVVFFWREIEAWAQRILREVHTLASAYGWGEEEILALSPVRRQCYVDLVGA
jgi:hypothetical protein